MDLEPVVVAGHRRQIARRHALTQPLAGVAAGAQLLQAVRVEAEHRVMLFREGELVRELEPGLYVFWKQAGKIVAKTVEISVPSALKKWLGELAQSSRTMSPAVPVSKPMV